MALTRPIRPLIFDSLEVGWPQIFAQWGDEDLNGELAYPSPLRLSTFATPAALAGTPVDAVSANEAGLVFPHFGAWYLRCRYGAFKFLLLDPAASRDNHVMSIVTFAAENCVHSMADAWLLVKSAKSQQPFQFTPMAAKLFFSDQPLHLMCGHIEVVVSYLLHTRGFLSRRVSAVRANKQSGHIINDVFLPDQNKWAMVDPDFGFTISSGGQVLSSHELRDHVAQARDDLAIGILADKGWLKPINSGYLGAIGQMTWTPEHSQPAPTVSQQYYRKVVEEVFVNVTHYEYTFKTDATGTYKLIKAA